MKHFLLVLIVVVLSFACVVFAAPAKNEIVKDTLLFEGKKRTYYLFVPAGLSDKTAVPLVVTLQGSGRNGLSLVEKRKDLAATEGLIIVGPDALNSQSWDVPQDGPDFLHALVEALKTKYPINPRRVYLFGHSAGANMGLYMSLYESEYISRRPPCTRGPCGRKPILSSLLRNAKFRSSSWLGPTIRSFRWRTSARREMNW